MTARPLSSGIRSQSWPIASIQPSVSTISAWSPGPTHTNLIFDVVTPFGFRLEDAEVARQLRALIRTFDSHYVPVIQVEHSYI